MTSTQVPRRRFRFIYETTIRRADAAKHAVDVWIPVATSDAYQTIDELDIVAPVEVAEGVEPVHGNRMLHARIPRGHDDAPMIVSYDVERCIRRVEPPSTNVRYPDDFDRGPYQDELSADANVPLDGFVGYQARLIAQRRDPPVVKARKLFDYLLHTLEYDWAGCTPDRIHELGNLAQACDLRKGTCTEFHGLYVGYARALGIPARFCFGFNIPGDRPEGIIAGYHCWAEILLPEVGWFPVDVTEGLKAVSRGEDMEFHFGGLHARRVQVSSGRDVALTPPQSGPPLDKFIFSHALRGGQVVEPELSFWVAPPRRA